MSVQYTLSRGVPQSSFQYIFTFICKMSVFLLWLFFSFFGTSHSLINILQVTYFDLDHIDKAETTFIKLYILEFTQGEIVPLYTVAQDVRSYILKAADIFSNLVFCFILLLQSLFWGFNNSGFQSDQQEEFEVLSNKTDFWGGCTYRIEALQKKKFTAGEDCGLFLPGWLLNIYNKTLR